MNILSQLRRRLSAPAQTSLSAPPQQEQLIPVQDPDEYDVYRTVVDTKYFQEGLKQFVIATETASSARSPFIGVWHGRARGGKRPEVEPEISLDFDARNTHTGLLTNQFTMALPYALVSQGELRKIFYEETQDQPDTQCWRRFSKQYSGAPGILAFSRVGFNLMRAQALVYVEN